jgi:PAS domain S-box-containing protein
MGMLNLVAEQAALALSQAEMQREAQDSARCEALIGRITSALHRSLDPEAVLQSIVDELGAALSVCRCRLGLLPDWMPEHVSITHQYTAPCCALRPGGIERIPVRDDPHLEFVLAADSPLAVDDVSKDPRLAPYLEKIKAAGVRSLLAAAIRFAGRPIGFFALHHCERDHHWTQWEIDIVSAVARQAAVAIRQAQLHREARESAIQSALTNEIVAAIRHSLDLKKTLQVAVDELGRALRASRVYFRDLRRESSAVLAEYVSSPELSIKHLEVETGGFISRSLVKTRRTIVIDDVLRFMAQHPDEASTVALWKMESRNLSQIVCPIFVNGELLGGVAIGQTDYARKWTAPEIALIEAVTAQIEVAVSHSQLFEEARAAAHREALISRLTHRINQSNRLDEIFPVVAGELGAHLQSDRLEILQFDHERRRVTLVCKYDKGEVCQMAQDHAIDEFSGFRDLIEDGLLVIDDAQSDTRLTPDLESLLEPTSTRALMVAPLYYEGQPRFALCATMSAEARRWSEEEKYILREAANQVFAAFERAELFEKVSHGKFQWEATFDALTDGIFIFDQDGSLTRANTAAAAFEGARAMDLIGRKCCSLLPGIEESRCQVARVIETGRPVTFELVPEKLNRPLLVTITPLANGPRRYGDWVRRMETEIRTKRVRTADGAVCIVRDLSELRAAEAAAREQHNFLIRLLEHATDAIFALSPDGRFVWFNEQLIRLSGYTRREIKSGDFRKFLPPGTALSAMRRFAKAMRGEAQTFEMKAVARNGDLRLLLVTYTPIYDVGAITSILCIARDVTEERLASERAARSDKLRALGQLASGVAHNFNNILAAILGHAQLIKRACSDEASLERLDIIERAAVDGAETVKRIQGFGLHQEGAIAEMIDINQMVRDSTTLTQARWRDDAQSHGIHYQVDVALGSIPLVRGSASELREVFVNIILNALDAMPAGGHLSISTASSGATIQVRFADSGKGMTRDVRDHIFEPFFTTKGADGMGLGLAVSYSIVERHGGRIEVHSEPEQGSCFTITLPGARSALKETRQGTNHTINKANILVIDDDDRVREAMAGMLEAAGHRVWKSSNGIDGLEMIEKETFDIIFTDLSMPGIDGWAAASEIRSRQPKVKIVLMTGFSVSAETMNHHADLVDHVIPKPVRFEDINTILSNLAAHD